MIDWVSKMEIQEKLYLYCHAMDTLDVELAKTVFESNAHGEFGENFTGTCHEFIEFATSHHRDMIAYHHQIGNVLVEVSGDEAKSEAYITASYLMEPGPDVRIERQSFGRYVDEWRRRKGTWSITRRTYLLAFDRHQPVPRQRAQADEA